jgi:hypothetical protein
LAGTFFYEVLLFLSPGQKAVYRGDFSFDGVLSKVESILEKNAETIQYFLAAGENIIAIDILVITG